MRDYGKIQTGFWRSGPGKMLRGDPTAVIVALYLSTCPASAMTGLYYLPLVTLCHETGISVDDAKGALERLARADIAHYDADAELAWVPDMAAREVGPELAPGDKRIKGIAKAIDAFRGHRFREDFLARYGAAYALTEAPSKPLRSPLDGPSKPLPRPSDAPSEGLGSPFEAPSKPLRSQDQDQDQKQDQKPPHSAGAREEPAEVPGGVSVVDHEGHPVEVPLAPTPTSPAAPPVPADLVALVNELAAEGHRYGIDVAAQLAQGRALTHGQRIKLRQIHAERAAREREAAAPRPRAPPRQASPAVQRPAAPGERTWTIGEEI